MKWASVDAGFLLVPAGGLARDYYFDDGGVAHNSYYQYGTDRPQHYIGGDASYFAGAHELKLGASWRTTAADTRQIWPASHLIASWYGYPNMLVQVARDYHSATNARYVGGYVTDTISIDRLTVIGGVRFDRQSSSLDAASVPGVTWIRERSSGLECASGRQALRVEQPDPARRRRRCGGQVAQDDCAR